MRYSPARLLIIAAILFIFAAGAWVVETVATAPDDATCWRPTNNLHPGEYNPTTRTTKIGPTCPEGQP